MRYFPKYQGHGYRLALLSYLNFQSVKDAPGYEIKLNTNFGKFKPDKGKNSKWGGNRIHALMSDGCIEIHLDKSLNRHKHKVIRNSLMIEMLFQKMHALEEKLP